MSGYALCVGTCGSCHGIFSFNPNKVPSLNDIPFCKPCVDSANAGPRAAKGLPPIAYAKDAYEACPEEELVF